MTSEPRRRRPPRHRSRPASDADSRTRRRARRPVVLAARPRRPRGARVPRGRERLHRRRARAPPTPLRDELFDEIRGRVQETDASAPVPRRARASTSPAPSRACSTPCTAAVAGAAPRPGARRAPSEIVLLDENALAGRPRRTSRSATSRSPRPHDCVAYSIDTTGGERYALRFRDLATGARPPRRRARRLLRPRVGERQPRRSSTRGPTTRCARSQVWRHTLGTPRPTTCSCSEEDDERFFVGDRRARRSGRYVVIALGSKITSEVVARSTADDPTRRAARRRAARREGSSTTSSTTSDRRAGDRFFVLTNADGAENFKLVVTRRVATPGRVALDRGRPPPRPTCGSTTSTRSPTTSCSRSAPTALEQLRVLGLDATGDRRTSIDDAGRAGVLRVARRQPRVRHRRRCRYGYTSLVTPDVGLRLRPRRPARRRS